jgi:hypothetical protein
LKDTNASLAEQVGKFRSGALGTQLQALGFKGNPSALNVPDDLDPFDAEKVTEWAVGMSLVDKPEPSADEQRQAADMAAHDRMVAATAGATPPGNTEDQYRQRLLSARTDAEFDAILREQGGATP